MLHAFTTEYRRYKAVAEKALAQVSDDDLNHVPLPDGNSMTMLVRHLSGNLLSRMAQGERWAWITIPKGESAQYNRNPTKDYGLT